MYSFRNNYLKNAFDNSQNNFVVIGLRKYSVSNGTRTVVGTPITLNSSDIVQDSFSITSAITSNQNYDGGGCVASELRFKINNTDGKFDNLNLKGYECYVYMGNRNAQYSEGNVPTEYMVIDDASEIQGAITPCVFNKGSYLGATAYIGNNKVDSYIDELLPMGVFNITEFKNIFDINQGKVKSIEIVALDRMSLLDKIVNTSDILKSLSPSIKQLSCTYRSFQFAMVIDYLNKVLYDKEVANFDTANTGFDLCRMNWSDCSSVCSRNNKGISSTVGDVHQMGINLYVYDTNTEYAKDTTYHTYSTWEYYVPWGRKNVTYRTMLQCLCEMMGCNAYFNRVGLLEFDWLCNSILYSVTSRSWVNRRDKINLDKSKYKDFKYLTNETIQLAGASYETNAETSTTYYGNSTTPQVGIYQNISTNKLIGDSAKNSNGSPNTNKVHGLLATTMNMRNRFHYETSRTYLQFKYRPFECKYLNTPYLDLTDNVSTLGNSTYDSYLTDITYTNSTFMKLKSRGVENEN